MSCSRIFFLANDKSQGRKEHYQLEGKMSSRLLSNAQCPASRILKQCGVNPFNEYIPLKNLLTGAIIPADLEDDFIDFASKGQQSMQAFVQDRLVTTTAIKSFWDTLKKLGLSSYSTWYNEKSV